MSPGRSRIPRLADHQVNQLLADFNTSRPHLVCPKCSAKGHLIRQGTDKADPPMPAFCCNNCSKYLNHVLMRQCINQAAENISEHLPAPATTPPTLVFEHHEALPEFMQTIMNELNLHRQRLDEHGRLYDKLAQLTKELKTANARIAELEVKNARLNEQLTTQTPIAQPNHIDFPELNGTQASQHAVSTNPWSDTTRMARLRKPPAEVTPKRLQQRQTSAARMFTPLSANHGYRYVYFPARARMPTGQVRKHLRELGIANSRILDIHYPERKTMALLVHNDFAEELKQTLNKFGVTQIPDFDPLDPIHLKDPKYSDLSEDERAQKAFEHHCSRMIKAIENLRAPVKYSVAKSFADEGWIASEELKTIFNKNKDHAADIFHRSGLDHSMSFDTDNNSTSTMSALGHDFE